MVFGGCAPGRKNHRWQDNDFCEFCDRSYEEVYGVSKRYPRKKKLPPKPSRSHEFYTTMPVRQFKPNACYMHCVCAKKDRRECDRRKECMQAYQIPEIDVRQLSGMSDKEYYSGTYSYTNNSQRLKWEKVRDKLHAFRKKLALLWFKKCKLVRVTFEEV